MKKYSLAINSIVFLTSVIIGIFIINITIKSNDFVKNDPALRIVNLGEIFQISPHSFIFQYSHEDDIWKIEIEITDDTQFYISNTLSENDIIYGREIKEVARNELIVGKKAVVDWKFIEKRGYVATDIIFVDPNSINLLY